jgi:hypothetical protein
MTIKNETRNIDSILVNEYFLFLINFPFPPDYDLWSEKKSLNYKTIFLVFPWIGIIGKFEERKKGAIFQISIQ